MIDNFKKYKINKNDLEANHKKWKRPLQAGGRKDYLTAALLSGFFFEFFNMNGSKELKSAFVPWIIRNKCYV